MGTERAELLLFGYIRNKYDAWFPPEIIKLCILFFNEEFRWILNMKDLISMKSREYVTSSPIKYTNDLSFHCKVYSSSKGFRKIRLHLLFMSNDIRHCIVSSSLYCDEIDSYSRQVYKYCPHSNKTKHSIRIPVSSYQNKYKLNLNEEYQDLEQLTIRCNIHSVEITYNNQHDDIYNLYDGKREAIKRKYFPLNEEMPIFKKNVNFTWNLDAKLLKLFKNSQFGASYFSPQFDQWDIICTPNGATSRVEGRFQIGLQIVKWPKDISTMEIQFIVQSQFDEKPKKYIKEFNIENNMTEFYCSQNTFKSALIGDNLSFHVTINILVVYDEMNDVIPETEWSQYGIL